MKKSILHRYLNSLFKNWRLIHRTQKIIEDCQAIDKFNDHFSNSGKQPFLLVPTDRADGVGIQFMLRAAVMFLAKQTGSTYIHLPFLKIAHQHTDSIGCNLTNQEWSKRWETFFSLGLNHPNLVDFSREIGSLKLAHILSLPSHQFHGYSDDISRIPPIVDYLRITNPGEIDTNKLYVFGLGLCQASRDCQLAFDRTFIETLRSKYHHGVYRPTQFLYDKKFLNIAIHIRRGDAWDNYKKGKKDNMFQIRILDENFYIEMIEKISSFQNSASKQICFHIFTDGQQEDFKYFIFNNNSNAYLNGKKKVIENINFHFNFNAFDSLYHLITAPILIPGKSSFSLVAALLNDSFVCYFDEILEFYQYNLVDSYLHHNSRCVSLDNTNSIQKMINQL